MALTPVRSLYEVLFRVHADRTFGAHIQFVTDYVDENNVVQFTQLGDQLQIDQADPASMAQLDAALGIALTAALAKTAALQSTVDNHVATIGELQANVQAAQDALQNEQGAHQATEDALGQQLADARGDIATAQTQVQETQAALDVAAAAAAEQKAQFDAQYAALDAEHQAALLQVNELTMTKTGV